MKGAIIAVAIITAITLHSCKQSEKENKEKMSEQSETLFPKGDKITNNNFTGTAWLNMVMENDSMYDMQIGNVTFEPGARTNWHSHPGGQILIVTEGKGFHQEKDKPIEIIKKGDIIKCPPNVIHWHGASSSDTLVHIAISPNTDKGKVVWLEKVSDEEYGHLKK